MAESFMIETSARHVHLTVEDIKTLFGCTELTIKKELSQPGQYAYQERVTVVGPKKEIAGVIVLGPPRKATQVEVSLTDARSLGIDAPIRESGLIDGSGACILKGPCGEINLTQGVIIAKRHIHMSPEDATRLGVADKQIVGVKVKTGERSTIFGDVVVRVSDSFKASMHIDTDEANAAGISGEVTGEIVVF